MKFDVRYLRLARFIAMDWSKDPSTKVGCVIADARGKPVSFGYNGFAAGVADTPARLNDRQIKYALMVHAERNALLFADRARLHGANVYIWPFPPCGECASMLVQAEVARVVTLYPTQEQVERWGPSFKMMKTIFEEGGVELVYADSSLLDG